MLYISNLISQAKCPPRHVVFYECHFSKETSSLIRENSYDYFRSDNNCDFLKINVQSWSSDGLIGSILVIKITSLQTAKEGKVLMKNFS